MTIQVLTQPYEILIRFNNGALFGAHYKTLDVLTDGERVYSTTENPPVSVSGETCAEVLGVALQAALLKAGELEADLLRERELGAEMLLRVGSLEAELMTLRSAAGVVNQPVQADHP